MRVVIDIEANSLVNPQKVWLIVCRDIDTGEYHVFETPRPTSDGISQTGRDFLRFAASVTYWIGHNFLEYDYPVLHRLLGLEIRDVASPDVSIDTLLLSRLCDYSRTQIPRQGELFKIGGALQGTRTSRSSSSRSLPLLTEVDVNPGMDAVRTGQVRLVLDEKDVLRSTGSTTETDGLPTKYTHSIESYGLQFGIPKGKFNDFTKYSPDMLEYCKRDVDICYRVWCYYRNVITDPGWQRAIRLEQEFQAVVNALHNNGFSFNTQKAEKLLTKVQSDLGKLDEQIAEAFPPKEVLIREFTPKATKFGSISKTSVPRSLWTNLSDYEVGKTYRHTKQEAFNPASHKQLIDVLSLAGWIPTDKTQTHIDFERSKEKDIDRSKHFSKYGWKINENNLSTLPPSAPVGARLLAKRILLESRRRSLTEWIGLCDEDGRIHGRFYGIGAWTGRMAHQQPNTANIPNEFDTQGQKKLLGKELRSLWQAPKGRLLVGVDAEGIQLRVFAHLIDDKEFTDALVNGKKSDKTDPHSLNQRIIGSVCHSRAAAKRFIYALLLGAGLWKLSRILECSETECQEALDRLLQRYVGWEQLKQKTIPADARCGFFTGLDGRKVFIPGQSFSERKHLAMSGYLQSGEAIIMKTATLKWMKEIEDARTKGIYPSSRVRSLGMGVLERPLLVNFVHDEWQTETGSNMAEALWVAEAQSRALRSVGEELGLKCPLSGSYWNDDHQDYTIGTNWSVTH